MSTGHHELPPRWEAAELGDAAHVVMGQSPPGSSYNTEGHGDPFFQGKKEFGALHPTVEKWTTAGTRFADPGDILMSVRAPVGPTNVANQRCAIGRGLAAIRANSGLDQSFLLWTLRHFEGEIAARGTGTTFDSISGDALRSQRLGLPPLDEQEQIVEVLEEHLSRLDAALANIRAVRTKAAQFRRSLLHAAFGGDLTGGDADRRQVVTLGTIAELVNGRAYKKAELLEEGKYRVLRVGNFFSSNSWYWSDLELPAKNYCDHGDLLYAWSASFGPRIWDGEKVIFHYHIWKIVEDPQRVDRDWLKLWFDYDVDLVKAALGTGTTMMHVTKREMEKRLILLPALAAQQRVAADLAAKLSRLDAVLAAADRLEAQCAALRRSLLHAAFTGKLTEEWRETAHV
jgi:type I restriction enzyme S subunit